MRIPRRSDLATTRWFTPENPDGAPGAAGRENRGAKGRAFVPLEAGGTLELARLHGSGTLRRVWLTLSDLSPAALRGIRVEAYWDGAASPAIDAPLGDLFGAALGRLVPVETALFSSPEGRSLVLSAPMPFLGGAVLRLVNDAGPRIERVFYEVDATLDEHPDDILYLHAGWRRERPVALGEPFEVAAVRGAGRFLGMQLGVVTDPVAGDLWWGEGEVRMRVDESTGWTLSGTGLEDHVGTGWGMGPFAHRAQGCPIADPAAGCWTPYRLHLDDPVWFSESLVVAVDAVGGGRSRDVLAARERGAELRPITMDVDGTGLLRLLDGSTDARPDDPAYADAWTNFFRRDDYSATAWLYLDRPERALAPLPPAADRLAGL